MTIIGGGIYGTPEDAMHAAFGVVGPGVGFSVIGPSIQANGWSWKAELTREQLHNIAQRTKDPSTLHPQMIEGIKANQAGPSMRAVETTFQDMFGPSQEPAWERTTDEHGGRVFRKKDDGK